MRFPEDKIKEAILHPDPDIRDRATRYFSKSSRPDPSIIPLVIRAVEKYGREGAYDLIGTARDLPQTEASIAWVIDELNNEQSDKYENYVYNLSMLLVKADPVLLLPREPDILAPAFSADLAAPLVERLRLVSWSFATCWEKLEELCEQGKHKQYITDFDIGQAHHLVEALARFGKENEEKAQAILSQQVEDLHDNPMKWLVPLVVRLAGQAHLGRPLPLLIGKLQEDGGDLLNQECEEALVQIGTPAVLHAVADAFPDSKHRFRLYACASLERIHSDLAVEKCLPLLRQEKDRLIQVNLAHALLCQFATEGIEPARRLLLAAEIDFYSRDLLYCLLETAVIMGEGVPERDKWLAAEKTEQEAHKKRVKELEGDPKALILYALEKLTGRKPADVPRPRPPLPPAPPLALPRRPVVNQKVGRNSPCPCRSGKKFKNCCMRK